MNLEQQYLKKAERNNLLLLNFEEVFEGLFRSATEQQ